MSAATEEKVAPVKAPSEPLFGKKQRRLLSDPLDDNNPITIQVLGICSALAVTTQMKPTFVLSVAVISVMIFSSLLVSLLRDVIPSRVRIIVQLAVISSMVILVDQVLKAYFYDVSKTLSVFVGLIITNCIVMGRLEAYAMGNKPWNSALDGLGNGMGYAWIILVVAFFRELWGSGAIFGFKVFEAVGLNIQTNGLMVSPIGAFIILGLLIWVQRTRSGYVEN